ncbi:glycosyl hydrolase 108 family protein [Methylomonas sp. AM2-LC]|uniref:glycoside hydrolase family 108 protein n=1 Tax=Methylomonas sp. AM2-LC TaxID=3153301 RepID=UPI00326427B2
MTTKPITIATMIADILQREGGYTNNPADRGGPTNHGITLHTYSVYLGRLATIAELKAITPTIAAHIYQSLYYIKPNIDVIPLELQPIVFDESINMDPENAAKLLQETLKHYDETISVDGKIGPITANKAHEILGQVGATTLINQMVDQRIDFYKAIVDHNPIQHVFINGWINRANQFRITTEA